MNNIYKFELECSDNQTVDMPKNAKILSVQIQYDKIQMWAEVDLAGKEFEPRKFKIIGTGHPFAPFKGNHIGTIQRFNGRIIWHVYEVLE